MIGDILKQLREEKGYFQRDVAEKLEIATTTYSGYENNSRQPSPDILCKLADCFHVSVDFLLGRKSSTEFEYLSSEITELSHKISKVSDSDLALLKTIVNEMYERSKKKEV